MVNVFAIRRGRQTKPFSMQITKLKLETKETGACERRLLVRIYTACGHKTPALF